MAQTDIEFLSRLESLGDNCELGFVLRKAKYEKGGLFRWTITPVDKLIGFLENPEKDLFCRDSLVPYGPGMVLDLSSGFSFHSQMRSEKNDQGVLEYVATEAERAELFEIEKSKIDYLKESFLKRLRAPVGSIYIIKANNGIDPKHIRELAALLDSYSSKHVLVEVSDKCDDLQEKNSNMLVDCGSHFSAKISRFAHYVAANDICYSDWEQLIFELKNCKKISERLGVIPKAA